MTIHVWLASSLVRHFPLTPARPARPIAITAARNERVSFQVGLRLADGVARQNVRVEVSAPAGLEARVRRVGYVPLQHHNTDVPLEELDGVGHIPGYVPDPLFDEARLLLPAGETHAFFVTLTPDGRLDPGQHVVKVQVIPENGKPRTLSATLALSAVAIAPRRDFRVTNWFYNDALLDYYRCQSFDDRYWQILPRYLQDLATHGQDTVYAPVFTPPLDGVKRPSQLLHVTRVAPDRYRFDWQDVRRYVRLARQCGLTHFEWTHLFTQWGVKHALRIYRGQGADERLLWPAETPATSATYRKFLAQFLPELHTFLRRERLLDRSFFHVSDEPHGEEHKANYRQARGLLRELAPWMQVMDALSDLSYGRERLTDMPIASIQTALDFVREGLPCWCYYCCGPRGRFLNRLLDTPLAKIRMNGWLFYRWPFGGFLHWGYNYWYRSQTREMIDPYTVQDGCAWSGGWAYGDTFMVYPGPDGPVDSLRWEAFGDSLQEYALLQTLGVQRGDPLLQNLKSFEDFPKTEAWLTTTRRKLLARTR